MNRLQPDRVRLHGKSVDACLHLPMLETPGEDFLKQRVRDALSRAEKRGIPRELAEKMYGTPETAATDNDMVLRSIIER